MWILARCARWAPLLVLVLTAPHVACSNTDAWEPEDPLTSESDGATSPPGSYEGGETADVLRLRWPVQGVRGKDWVITNYVDADFQSGLADYSGATGPAAKTYNRHHGTDIHISSFRRMDEGVAVVAAAPGEITSFETQYVDRHTACEDHHSNFIQVYHPGGYWLYYDHLRRRRAGEPRFQRGDEVQAGDILGYVGSSGCSDSPHLHFEIAGRGSGNWIDPFPEGLWIDPPSYDAPIALMETWTLRGPEVKYPNPSQDPPLQDPELEVGETLLAYAVFSGDLEGAKLGARVLGPEKSAITLAPIVVDHQRQRFTASWAAEIPGPPGEWAVEYSANGELMGQTSFEVY